MTNTEKSRRCVQNDNRIICEDEVQKEIYLMDGTLFDTWESSLIVLQIVSHYQMIRTVILKIQSFCQFSFFLLLNQYFTYYILSNFEPYSKKRNLSFKLDSHANIGTHKSLNSVRSQRMDKMINTRVVRKVRGHPLYN